MTAILKNTEELKKLQTKIARLEKLLEISRTLNSNLNLDTLLLSIVNVATQLTQTEDASILLLDERTGALYFEATTNQKKEVLARVMVPLEGSVAGWIVTHGKPLVLNDASGDPRHYAKTAKEINFVTKALMGVPLTVKEKTIGVLEVLNPKDNAPFTEDDVNIITILATQAAVAIENARLFQQSDQINDIVHELRTPITSIVGFSSLLLARKDFDLKAQKSFLKTINREADRLGKMINNFLDLARLETRRAHPTMKPINLNDLIKDAVSLFQTQTHNSNLKLNYDLPATPLSIIADPTHIKQIMINLISNAIKYNKPGGSININLQQKNQHVEIKVIDTGRGISPEALKNIFDKFYRVIEEQHNVEGTGLGLSIVKEIVEAHGGSITVKSTPNQGSVFTIKFPTPEEATSLSSQNPKGPVDS